MPLSLLVLLYWGTSNYRQTTTVAVSTAVSSSIEDDSTFLDHVITMKNRGKALGYQRKIDSALIVFDSCLNHLPREPKTDEEFAQLAWAYANRAYLYQDAMGDYLNARDDYLKAISLFETIDSSGFLVTRYIYEPLGNIYTRLSENEQAIRLLKKFKNISLQSNEHAIALADAHNDLGRAYMFKGNFSAAVREFKAGIEVCQTFRINSGLLNSSIAQAYLLSHQYEPGLKASTECLKQLEQEKQLTPPSSYRYRAIENYIIGGLRIQGMLLTRSNAYQQARVSLQKALVRCEKMHHSKHRSLAKIYTALGDLELAAKNELKAYGYYHKALLAATPEFSNDDIHTFPKVDALHPEVALGEALIGKAKSARALGDSLGIQKWYPRAVDAYKTYFSWENKLRNEQQDFHSKLDFTSEIHQNGEQALETVYALYASGYGEKIKETALNFMHQSKGILLSESNSQLLENNKEFQHWIRMLKSQNMQLNFYQRDLRKLQTEGNTTEIADLEKRIASLDVKRQSIRAEIRRKFKAYNNLVSKKNVPLVKLRSYLKNQNADFLSYFEGVESTFLVAVTDGKLSFNRLNTQLLRDVETSFVHRLHSPNLASVEDYQKDARSLYDSLVGVVSHELRRERLIISPDGLLNSIPFEALVTKSKKNPHFKKLAYFIREKTIYYTPSIERLLVKNTNGKQTFLGLANSFKNSSKYAHLPYAVTEVNAGSTLFKSTTRQGKNANKDSFLKNVERASVVHLATHAGLDSSGIEEPWLTFGEEDRQKLITSELLQLRLSCDLVLLNACETGSGQYYAGEGVLSFSRAFMDAGARNIMTNLWSVNHAANSKLINSFYRKLGDGSSPASALREAKIAYLNNNNTDSYSAHPYFWTSLILMGNNETINTPEPETPHSWYWFVIIASFFAVTTFFFIRLKSKSKN